jgi:predicted nucleic acid-binding Zn ribbon protein
MPEKIGTVLQRLLERYDILREIEKERLISEWYKLSSNKILTFCSPAYIDRDILYLKAKNEHWFQALKGKEKEISQIIKRTISLKYVERIIFIS